MLKILFVILITSYDHNFKIYQTIRENGGWDEGRMIEIEKRLVKDKRESERIETEIMEQLQSDMNCRKSHSGFETKQEYQKEYHQKHREKSILYSQGYYRDYKDTLNLKAKEKITCECGCLIRKIYLAKHKKS